MHVAVVVGTMLLGSWVLNSPDSEEEAGIPEEAQQQEQRVVPPSPASPYQSQQGYQYQQGQEGQTPRYPSSTPRTQSGGGAQQQQIRPGSAAMQKMVMPSSPTDSNTAEYGQPFAPTTTYDSRGARMGPLPPSAPTEPSFRTRGTGLQSTLLGQNRSATTRGNSGTAAAPSAEKAFSGYQSSSGVSPYMNLFRVGGETIDNYTSLVRPQIEQRFLNQQFNREIRNLDNTSRMQRVDLQQLYRSNETLQGVATPQFYMNYGNYYQGAR